MENNNRPTKIRRNIEEVVDYIGDDITENMSFKDVALLEEAMEDLVESKSAEYKPDENELKNGKLWDDDMDASIAEDLKELGIELEKEGMDKIMNEMKETLKGSKEEIELAMNKLNTESEDAVASSTDKKQHKPYKGKKKKKNPKIPLVTIRNIDTMIISGPMTYEDAKKMMGREFTPKLIDQIGSGKPIRGVYGVYELKHNNDRTRWISEEPGYYRRFVLEAEAKDQLRMEEAVADVIEDKDYTVEIMDSTKSSYKELLITNKIDSLVINKLIPMLRNFPKHEKLGLSLDIRNNSTKLATSMSMASRIMSKRVAYSQDADCYLEALRYCLKLAVKQRYMSIGGYNDVSLLVDEISRLISAYIKTAINKNKLRRESNTKSKLNNNINTETTESEVISLIPQVEEK